MTCSLHLSILRKIIWILIRLMIISFFHFIFHFSFYSLCKLENGCIGLRKLFFTKNIVNNYWIWSICVSRPRALVLAFGSSPGPCLRLQFVFDDPDPQFVFTGHSPQFISSVLRFTVKVLVTVTVIVNLISSAYLHYFFKLLWVQGCVIVTVSTYLNSASNYMHSLFTYNVGNKKITIVWNFFTKNIFYNININFFYFILAITDHILLIFIS